MAKNPFDSEELKIYMKGYKAASDEAEKNIAARTEPIWKALDRARELAADLEPESGDENCFIWQQLMQELDFIESRRPFQLRKR